MRLCVPCTPIDDGHNCIVALIDENGQEINRCDIPDSSGDELMYGTYCKSTMTVAIPGIRKGVVYLIEIEENDNKEDLKYKTTIQKEQLGRVTNPLGCSSPPGKDDVIVSGSNGIAFIDTKTETINQNLSEDIQWPGVCHQSQDNRYIIQTQWADSTVWTSPFSRSHTAQGRYGSHIHIWDTTKNSKPVSADLGLEGISPLTVCFLKSESGVDGYVGCCPATTVFYFKLSENGEEVKTTKVIDLPITVRPSTAIHMSMTVASDDRFLFLSSWLSNEIRQYDIARRDSPLLVGRIAQLSYRPSCITSIGDYVFTTSSFLRAWESSTEQAAGPVRKLKINTRQGGVPVSDTNFHFAISEMKCAAPILVSK